MINKTTFTGLMACAQALLGFLRITSGLLICMLLLVSGPSLGEVIHIEKNVAVPMRDGVVLRADVRRPAREGKYPVLVFRTPYSKDEGDEDNEITFAEALRRGYALVIQDVRGRYASDGEFAAYQNEGKDGYDTIEWAATQPWSDGRVGTLGLSYPGAVQWLAAVESPPHLLAMVPAMSFSSPEQSVYFGGVFESAWVSWVYQNMAPDIRRKKNLPGPQTIEAAKMEWERLGGNDAMQGRLPAMELPYLTDTSPYYYKWLENQPYGAFWEWGRLAGKYDRVKAAVLNLSGWYDEPYGSEGAITNYLGILKSRRGDRDRGNRLIIGPWIHGVDATGTDRSGNRQFGANAKINYHQVVLDWLDFHVRGIESGSAGEKPVRVYVMGSNRWIESDVWPLRGTTPRDYFLVNSKSSAGKASRLQTVRPGRTTVSSFVSDPLHPVRDEFETNWGGFDLRGLAERKDVLTFETEPFAEDKTVVGHVGAEIFASSDAPDFDLYVKIIDVAPDGTAFNLQSAGHEVLRASYRDMTEDRKLLKPGEVVKLTLRNMMTGNTFKAGHRLRVYLLASWFPTYARNLQTGLLETTSGETRKATINIHGGAKYPSRVILPEISTQ